jgi:hypothetical protein
MQDDTATRMYVQNVKQTAAALACSATLPAPDIKWIARNGSESIFALIKLLLPEVMKPLNRPQSVRLHLK